MITIEEIDEYIYETFEDIVPNGPDEKLYLTVKYFDETKKFEVINQIFGDVYCEGYNDYHKDKAIINIDGVVCLKELKTLFYNVLERFIEEEYKSVLDREDLDYDDLISAVKRLEDTEKKYYEVWSLANSDKNPKEIVEKIREIFNIKKV